MDSGVEEHTTISLFSEYINSKNGGRVQSAEWELKRSKIEIISKDNFKIVARISMKGDTSYLVELEEKENGLSQVCSCSFYHRNECNHPLLLALYVLKNPFLLDDFHTMSISYEEKNWLKGLAQEGELPVKSSDAALGYIFIPKREKTPILTLEFASLKQKKNKEFKLTLSKTYPLSEIYHWPDTLKKCLMDDDWEVLHLLLQSKLKGESKQPPLLKRLIETGRCFFQTIGPVALKWGEEREGCFEWDYQNNGKQTICFEKQKGSQYFFLNGEALYIDEEKNTSGFLRLPLSVVLAKKLLTGPSINIRKSALIQEKLSSLLKNVPVKEKSLITLVKSEFTPHVHLSAKQRGDGYDVDIKAELFFVYQGVKFPYDRTNLSGIAMVTTSEAVYKIERQLEKEMRVKVELESFGFTLQIYPLSSFNLYEDGDFQNVAVRLIQSFIDPKRKKGWTFSFSDSFFFHNIHEVDEWYVEGVESEQNWLNLELGSIIDGKRVNLVPVLRKVMDSLGPQNILLENFSEEELKHKMLVSIGNGDAVFLPLNRLKIIFGAFFGLLEGGDKVRLSKWNAPALGELQEGFGEKLIPRIPKQYEQLKESLRHIKKITLVAPPVSLKCELRPYQLEGLSWLQFLRESNLAGILADDMGLGKTIQTLGHILLEKESGRMEKPVLIIAPTTLMGNWLKETNRFAPDLKVLVLQGDERKKYFDLIDQNDIILTTYPLLAKDHEVLLNKEFHLLVLDEAQNIKNAKTQAHQVIQKIKVKHKVCLTGTPMENHLGELWSFFHILLPGFLGDEKHFQQVFRKPIEKEGSLERKKILQKKIHPFMLRRTKGEVVLELPPKTEILSSLELSEKQKDLYEAVRLTMMKKVLSEVESKGLGRSRIIVLDALLKLRQICCDPRLLKSGTVEVTGKDSAKLTHLMEFIPQLLQEKRQILLFSQFTSMLTLIEQELRLLEIPYAIVTGDTKDRINPVEEFQKGVKPLMLISLKAGGTGLNLTAADTVIHYDPWWNPAVESQATDRAHRMGQTKPVFVYKFIATGSIEEKILGLQTRKKEMAEGLFDASNTKPLEMNLEDLHTLFAPLDI